MKLFFIILLSSILVGCSLTSSVNNNLFNDGERLVEKFYSNSINSPTSIPEMTKELDSEVDYFTENYDLNNENFSDDEKKFIHSVSRVYLSFIEYHLDNDALILQEFYDNIEKVKTEYNFDF